MVPWTVCSPRGALRTERSEVIFKAGSGFSERRDVSVDHSVDHRPCASIAHLKSRRYVLRARNRQQAVEGLGDRVALIFREFWVSARACRQKLTFKQCLGDRRPFLVERSLADRLARAAIPIGGVAGVALLAMQIGVHPVARPALVGLRRFMRAVPIPSRVEPQRAQGLAQGRRRLGGASEARKAARSMRRSYLVSPRKTHSERAHERRETVVEKPAARADCASPPRQSVRRQG